MTVAPVSVQDLHLRGDMLHREALLAGLDELRWPAADESVYLIVRRVHARGPWWQAVDLARQDVHALAAGAVSGWSPGAADAAAVRFADLADLLACLSHDLATGRAATLWYWRAWLRVIDTDPATAIVRLWCEHPTRLPDLLATLSAHGLLPRVYAQLGEQQVVEIMAATRHATGWPLPIPTTGLVASAARTDSDLPVPRLQDWQAEAASLPAPRVRALLPLLALASGWLQIPQHMHRVEPWLAWCRAVAAQLAGARTPEDDTTSGEPQADYSPPQATPAQQATPTPAPEPDANRARSHTESAVADLVPSPPGAPVATSTPDDGEAADGAATEPHETAGSASNMAAGRTTDEAANGSISSETPSHAAAQAPFRDQPGPTSPPVPTSTHTDPATRPRTAHAHVSDAVAAMDRRPPSPDKLVTVLPTPSDLGGSGKQGTDDLEALHGQSRDGVTVPPGQAPGSSAIAASAEGRTAPDEPVRRQDPGFHTDQGGLFYLLNVLAHPAIAPCLEDAPEPGWQRLYRLGLHLGLACDPPLARFLAHRLELPDPARLAELPPLRDETQLCRLADRHFTHLAVWGPELLAVPAQAVYTRSHLDLYFPLSAVRLEVRRAGLDIDPGWLPWLGQVVHFHYRDPSDATGDMP